MYNPRMAYFTEMLKHVQTVLWFPRTIISKRRYYVSNTISLSHRKIIFMSKERFMRNIDNQHEQ